MVAVVAVYALVVAGGWLWLPLAHRLLPHTADRGAGAVRYLVLFLAGYLSWLLALADIGRGAFWGALALVALAGAAGWWRWHTETLAWVRANGRLLLMLEVVGVALYVALLVFRGYTADIADLGDKYMDLAIVNTIVQQPQVPPQHMWFAGHPLNYYYLGHWILALLVVVSGLPSYNLAIVTTPLLAVLCVQCCITLVATAVPAGRGGRWSLVGACLLLFCGSLNVAWYGVANWGDEWQRPFTASHISPPLADALKPRGNQFEMPAVGMLWGELHAHVLGIPVLLVGLALLMQRHVQPRAVAGPAWYVLFAVVLGSNAMINSWQYPLLLLVWGAVVGRRWLLDERKRRVGPLLLEMVLVAGGSLLAILPFLLTFEPFSTVADTTFQPLPPPLGRILVWSPVGTTLRGLVLSVGLPLILAGGAAVALLRGGGWRWLGAALLVGLLSALYRPVGVVLVPLVVAGGGLGLRAERGASFGGILLAIAALTLVACDYGMIPDYTHSRSTTIFKFYLLAWVLLSLAAPLLLSALLQRMAPRRWPRILVVGVLVFLLAAGSVYPLLRGRQWIRHHGDRWWGLNALAQIEAYAPDEAAALHWMRQQPGHAPLLEAVGTRKEGPPLQPARFSALTGRPTPMGWAGYVSLWHNYGQNPQAQQDIRDTLALLSEFAETGSGQQLQILMQRYQLEYVVWGTFEQQLWSDAAAATLSHQTPLRWQSGAVRIYGRPRDVPLALAWLPTPGTGPEATDAWSAPERTSDTHQPFRWLQGTHGRIALFSERAAVVHLSFQVLHSTGTGTVSLWNGEQQLLQAAVVPHQPLRRVLWLRLPPGVTTLRLQTSVAPAPDTGYNRTITLAVAQPHVTWVSNIEQ